MTEVAISPDLKQAKIFVSVMGDEKEKALAFAGLEAASGYRWLSHGQAVGWGMVAASRLAHRRGLIREQTRQRMEAAISGLGRLPRLERLSLQKVLQAIRRDKKIGPRGLRFVLPVGVGKVEVVEGLSDDEIEWAVKSLGVGKKPSSS